MITLRIRHIQSGRVEYMPGHIWEIFIGKEAWEILEPEQQHTPPPKGRTVRAADLALEPVKVEPVKVEPVKVEPVEVLPVETQVEGIETQVEPVKRKRRTRK